MRALSLARQIALAILLFGMWAFLIYIHWFASGVSLRYIDSHQLDKVAHFSGGVFVALFFEWRISRIKLWQLLAAFFTIAVGWEIVEFLFDPDTIFFYSVTPDLWQLDSIGDVTAALLGCYGYWVFLRQRIKKPSA